MIAAGYFGIIHWYDKKYVQELPASYLMNPDKTVTRFRTISCSTGGYLKYIYKISEGIIKSRHEISKAVISDKSHWIYSVIDEAKEMANKDSPDKNYTRIDVHMMAGGYKAMYYSVDDKFVFSISVTKPGLPLR